MGCRSCLDTPTLLLRADLSRSLSVLGATPSRSPLDTEFHLCPSSKQFSLRVWFVTLNFVATHSLESLAHKSFAEWFSALGYKSSHKIHDAPPRVIKCFGSPLLHKTLDFLL